jgi:hypothetical protein
MRQKELCVRVLDQDKKAGIIKWDRYAETGKMQTVLDIINTFHRSAPSHTAHMPASISRYTLRERCV